jgi:hypothetical protein
MLDHAPFGGEKKKSSHHTKIGEIEDHRLVPPNSKSPLLSKVTEHFACHQT